MASNNWSLTKKEKPTGLKITFESGTTINIGSIERKVKDVEIVNMFDDVPNKKVIVSTSNGLSYTLWEGNEYDTIGNWTNEQVVNKVKELILSGK